jgi:hypothetical protein
MTSELVKVEKELLYELLDFKIRSLTQEIDSILTRWKYNNAPQFLEEAKNGTLKNAEMDAILLKQLVADRDTLQTKKVEY